MIYQNKYENINGVKINMTMVLFNKVIEIFRCTMTVRDKFKRFNYFSHSNLR